MLLIRGFCVKKETGIISRSKSAKTSKSPILLNGTHHVSLKEKRFWTLRVLHLGPGQA